MQMPSPAQAKPWRFALRRANPHLMFIAESHAVLSGARLGHTVAVLTTAVDGFERGIRMGSDSSAGPMLMALAVASNGNFPFAQMRACLSIGDGDHFSYVMSNLAEG